MDVESKGFILCCTGDDMYFDLCNTLIRDIRSLMPETLIAVYTDDKNKILNADVLLEAERESSRLCKIKAMQKTPYYKSIYVDIDSRLLSPVPELFTILDTYDIALCFADRRDPMCKINWIPTETGIPLSSSTVAYKMNDKIAKIFSSWEKDYISGKLSTRKRRDQGYLARLLYICTEVKTCVLPNEYRLNTSNPQQTSGIVKIITGMTSKKDPKGGLSREKLNKIFNSKIERRTVIPLFWGFNNSFVSRIWLPKISFLKFNLFFWRIEKVDLRSFLTKIKNKLINFQHL